MIYYDGKDYRKIIESCITSVRGHLERTNCIISIDEIDKIISEDRVRVIGTEPLIFVVDHCHFYQLYYCINEGWKGIIDDGVLKALDEYGELYLDVTVGNRMNISTSIIGDLGFKEFRTYLKMDCRGSQKSVENEESVSYAEMKDMREIAEMLENSFNPMCDHLPDEKELIDYIEKRKVYAMYEGCDIAGVLLYDNTGARSYLRCLCVSEKYRAKGYGHVLVSKYHFDHKDAVKLFYLWVDSKNEPAKKLYERFGYKYAGVKNHIYIRNHTVAR